VAVVEGGALGILAKIKFISLKNQHSLASVDLIVVILSPMSSA